MSMIKPYKKCKKCGVLIVGGDLCEDCKPMTNADRIRQMTDEELEKIIGVCECCFCAYRGECEKASCFCESGKIAWLKQEVSEDAGSKTDRRDRACSLSVRCVSKSSER